MSDLVERLRHAHLHSAQRIVGSNIFEEAADEIERLRSDRASPEEIGAAWKAWHSRHGGKLGPGVAFVEALHAAFKRRAKGEAG